MPNIIGTNGNDNLLGTAHADRIVPLLGFDWVDGGEGKDILVVDYSGLAAGGYSYSSIYSSGGSFGGYIQSGDGQNAVSFQNIEKLQLNLDDGDSTFSLDGSALSQGAKVDVNAGAGIDRLEANFSALGGISFAAGLDGVIEVGSSTFINFESFFLTLGTGADTVKLGDYDDVVISGGGDDSVDLGGGNDLVIAGAGNDSLIGGNGNDTLYGEGGSNILLGGDGDDQLVSQGSDTVDGGDGYDRWQGDYQAAVENLTFAYDGSSGSVSNGTTLTSIDHVTFFGGSGNDVVSISGTGQTPEGANKAILFAGAGHDTLNVDLSDGVTSSEFIVIHSEGTSFSGNADGLSLSGFEQASFTGDDGDTAELVLFFDSDLEVVVQPDGTLTSNAGVTLANYAAFEIQAGNGNDTVVGGANSDTIRGMGGNDTIDGGGASDILLAGDGNDSVNGGEGDDLVLGGEGDDTINGGAGNDGLLGEGGSNVLFGGEGNDSLVSSGADTVDGGEGFDDWQGDYRFVTESLSFAYNGTFGSLSNGTTITGVERVTFFSGAGDDVFAISGSGRTPEGGSSVSIWSGDGYDTLSVDLANGAVGRDLISISAEGTSFSGSTGGVSFSDFEQASFTGEDGDTASLALFFHGGLNVVVQPDGTLTTNVGVTLFNYDIFRLTLGEGNDIVVSGAGRDTISGMGGDDIINGGEGGDNLFGGSGADTFVYNSIADTGFGSGRTDGILDFSSEEGDQIDLQNVIEGEFSFIGSGEFSGSGVAELRTQDAGDGFYFVLGDVNGDGVIDFRFVVLPTQELTGSDFLL